jgi:hypothetical protein
LPPHFRGLAGGGVRTIRLKVEYVKVEEGGKRLSVMEVAVDGKKKRKR